MSKTILAVIELDNYPEQVAERAAWLARQSDAELRFLMSESYTGPLFNSVIMIEEVAALAEQLKAMDLRALEELRDRVRGDDLKVTTQYEQSRSLTDTILDAADALNPTYVIKGTHYHRLSERASLSDLDWQLIRKLSQPLWFVKPRPMSPNPTIVAAVDPTHANDKPASLDQSIIDHARFVASGDHGRLLLLHTYQRLTEIGHRATWTIRPVRLPIEEIDQRIRIEHRALLDQLASANAIDEADVHQLPGRPNEILPSFSRTHGADLVIMGALSRSLLKRRILGDTAKRTLDHIECDVLVIHPGNEAASGRQAA
ncbi:MAG: universal stress protein [Pseudomonadota bacterium]